MTETGTLFIVATPIGHLDDITLRAISILNQVDIVAAEDTRHSQKLLQHYDIKTRMTSLHDHNESQRAKQLIEHLLKGSNVALISDAGTPLISDPGYSLVNQCRQAGMATDQFRFNGFLPVKQMAKQQALALLKAEIATSVFYESPRRIVNTLEAVIAVLGPERKVVIAKEITKAFETFYADTAENALAWLLDDPNHQRGEFVLMVAGVKIDGEDLPQEALSLLESLIKELPLKKAAAITAEHYLV